MARCIQCAHYHHFRHNASVFTLETECFFGQELESQKPTVTAAGPGGAPAAGPHSEFMWTLPAAGPVLEPESEACLLRIRVDTNMTVVKDKNVSLCSTIVATSA